MNAATANESILQRFDLIRGVVISNGPVTLLDTSSLTPDDVVRLVSKEADLQDRIQQLEIDLNVYKRIFTQTNAEKKLLEDENEQLKQISEKQQWQRGSFDKQTQPSRVVILLDGDGAIFTPQLIVLGHSGGHKAAIKLSDSIKEYIRSLNEISQFQLSTFVFFNKKGLFDTFSRCSFHSAKARLEDFIAGFNQASERFVMVDVGSGKEAADSKIKAFLEDESRLPETYKIIFGGCHDNGYVTAIRSHITSGFKQKFILLQSYAEHAAGFDGLELPILSIPGLFIPQKLGACSSTQEPPIASRSHSPPLSEPPVQDIPTAFGRGETYQFSQELGSPPWGVFHSPGLHPNILSSKAEHRSTTFFENASDYEAVRDTGPSNYKASGPRIPNPNVPLSQQKPAPCTTFYLLKSCKYRNACKYGHDFILEHKHIVEIQNNAKKVPCGAANANLDCQWGAACCYGHVCPSGPKCYFLKKGKCKFVGDNMHTVKDAGDPGN